MQFAPDTIDTLAFIVALANTVPGASRSGDDELSSPPQLTALMTEHSYSGRFDRDRKELAEVVRARALLRRIWTHSRDEAVPVVNRMLSDAKALPHLVRHDAFDWHLHATESSAPLAERIRVEAAFAFIDVIRLNEWERLRTCSASDCTGVFVDLSRNGSKRFCGIRCGNRMNMVDFRARAASAP